MTYEQQILKILSEVDDRGISVSALTKHVYNQNCTFFSQPDLHEVRQYVQQYLLRNSRSPLSLIESTGRRGYYRLNLANSADARQLKFEFANHSDEKKEEKPAKDLSLNLFDDF
jgi:hypothetical protein